jgi:ubiquinone/menaquinone biosynthesis C-methylase UbiE
VTDPIAPAQAGRSLETERAVVAAAFSGKAGAYDARALDHPVDRWAREVVRETIRRFLPPGGSILEINAGSGLEAAALAADGYRVRATDIAPGMLERARGRAATGPHFEVEERSFHELPGVEGTPFDLVLSSFGGLNCTDRLDVVAAGIAEVLRPGGVAVLVFMPPISPWEHVQVLRGHIRTATRRWRRDGVMANIAGMGVRTWYPSARSVEAAFGPGFRRVELRALCLFAPSMMLEGFPRRHKTLTGLGMWLDGRLATRWPFRLAGDFSILVLERRASDGTRA